MIPAAWTDEHRALVMQQQQQFHPGYEWQADEVLITDEVILALRDNPVTEAELVELATVGRGQYRDGDLRGFVIDHEQNCAAWNAWMVRAADGVVQYVSEPQGSRP